MKSCFRQEIFAMSCFQLTKENGVHVICQKCMFSAVRFMCLKLSGLWPLGFKHTYQANSLHPYMLQLLHVAMYSTVKYISSKKFWQIQQITAICQVFLPIFTISITLPMQMDFNSTKFFCRTFQSPYSPNFFTAKVFYSTVETHAHL